MEYLNKIKSHFGNIFRDSKNRVYALYILEGANVAPYKKNSLLPAQRINTELFNSLSGTPGNEFILTSFKVKVSAEEIAYRMVANIKDFSAEKYSFLQKNVNSFISPYISGDYQWNRRLYALSVEIPGDADTADKIKVGKYGTDSAEKVKLKEAQIWDAIPKSLNPIRADIEWVNIVFNRAVSRGFEIPEDPRFRKKLNDTNNSGFIRSANSFGQIMIEQNVERSLLTDEFENNIVERNPLIIKNISNLKNLYTAQYKSILAGRYIGVSTLDNRSALFPNGYTSYQTCFVISSFPKRYTTAVERFTYMVDLQPNLDADFSIRFSFHPELKTKRFGERFKGRLKGEAISNARDDDDMDSLVNRNNEYDAFKNQMMSELGGAVPMKIEVMFSFAHPNLKFLQNQFSKIKSQFEDEGFEIYHVIGGQIDTFKSMMPLTPATEVDLKLRQTTTAFLMGAALHVRQTTIGDSYGLPLAINKENYLGQVVFYNILEANDAGSASLAITGSKGSGKSYLLKKLTADLLAFNAVLHILDPSETQEHASFALMASSIINESTHGRGDRKLYTLDVNNPAYSLDFFKIFPEPKHDILVTSLAMSFFETILNLNHSHPAMQILETLISDRRTWKIRNNRDVFDYCFHRKDSGNNQEDRENFRLLFDRMRSWANNPAYKVFFDEVNQRQGGVITLPPLPIHGNESIVFNTSNLSSSRVSMDSKNLDLKQLFTRVVYLTIAGITKYRFFADTQLTCLIGDEMHMIKDSEVLSSLISEIDTKGRKHNALMVPATQLASHFGDDYRLIYRKAGLRQDTDRNSIETLEWLDMGSDPRIVDDLKNNTSPPNSDGSGTIKGREGEGYFSDNRFTAKVKYFGLMDENLKKAADTRVRKI